MMEKLRYDVFLLVFLNLFVAIHTTPSSCLQLDDVSTLFYNTMILFIFICEHQGFACNGVNLSLSLPKPPGSRYTTSEYADFTREKGKVYLICPLIFNGVCVKFYGYLDVENLVGVGHLQFDETLAQVEDHLMKETLGVKASFQSFDKG